MKLTRVGTILAWHFNDQGVSMRGDVGASNVTYNVTLPVTYIHQYSAIEHR
jgi:hypothetical protein